MNCMYQIRQDPEWGYLMLGDDRIETGQALEVLVPDGCTAKMMPTRLEIKWDDTPYFVGLSHVDVVGSWAAIL